MNRNRPVDQLVNYSVNDLLTVSSNPQIIKECLQGRKRSESHGDDEDFKVSKDLEDQIEEIQKRNREMYHKALSTVKKLRTVSTNTQKVYVPGIITFQQDQNCIKTLLEIASFEFNLKFFLESDKNGVKICMVLSQDENHKDEIKMRMNLEKSVRDTLNNYFNSSNILNQITTSSPSLDSKSLVSPEYTNPYSPYQQSEEQVFLNEEISKEFIQSDDDEALHTEFEVEDKRPENEKPKHERRDKKKRKGIVDVCDSQYDYNRKLTIETSENLELELELGYQTTPTYEKPRGDFIKENLKKFKVPLNKPNSNSNQKMVIAVLSKKLFTTTRIKNVFETFFFKSKPSDVNNFYIKPTLTVTYTASEYKKKKVFSKLIQRIKKLQKQNNEDFREIDSILNHNKAAAVSLAEKQREYESLDQEVTKKLTPMGKDIPIQKRLNEAIFLMVIGIWFAFVCFFNPKLVG